jgi:hypothetical protein
MPPLSRSPLPSFEYIPLQGRLEGYRFAEPFDSVRWLPPVITLASLFLKYQTPGRSTLERQVVGELKRANARLAYAPFGSNPACGVHLPRSIADEE